LVSRKADDIVCYEIGSGDMPAWSISRRELGDDFATINLLAADRRLIEVDIRGDQVAIRGATRIGLVVLPSGRRLIIRSKVPSLKLLEWLAYLGEFPQLTSWSPDAGVSVGDDWHQCLASLFLNALERATRRHVRKDYVSLAANEPEIRGRVLTTALGRRLHRLPRVPQIQRRRSLATPFNIVLALALDRLPVLLADGRRNDRLRMARLRDQWASVPRDIHDPVAAVTAAQWACPSGYREALQLARLILIGAVLDPWSNMGGRAFTLPMATIWEKALRRMIRELAGETGWNILAKEEHSKRWDDPTSRDDPKRWLTADVIAERTNARWVLDAKYKCEFGDESRVDRFQMCTYAVIFDADRVSLVYPTGTSLTNGYRVLLSTHVGGKPLTIDSLALPLSAGPEVCRSALAQYAFADRGSNLPLQGP
jgi:5-methylcytosine-specific restriction endonuclease McrBC regulatory subunit McrC